MIDRENFMEDFKDLSPKEQAEILNKIGESFFIKECENRPPTLEESLFLMAKLRGISLRLNQHGSGFLFSIIPCVVENIRTEPPTKTIQ